MVVIALELALQRGDEGQADLLDRDVPPRRIGQMEQFVDQIVGDQPLQLRLAPRLSELRRLKEH